MNKPKHADGGIQSSVRLLLNERGVMVVVTATSAPNVQLMHGCDAFAAAATPPRHRRRTWEVGNIDGDAEGRPLRRDVLL